MTSTTIPMPRRQPRNNSDHADSGRRTRRTDRFDSDIRDSDQEPPRPNSRPLAASRPPRIFSISPLSANEQGYFQNARPRAHPNSKDHRNNDETDDDTFVIYSEHLAASLQAGIFAQNRRLNRVQHVPKIVNVQSARSSGS
ncbi:hypothetical protein LTR64_005931 [Lithohypha guttulata]|uniref:uncharacterized protein n=1 Tax=Lithohypha guttulata TaxID=1690604 RepID=UPI002DDE3A00|nr:hypothetical protein LTR51_002272 [Lithohypha guttulata]